MTGEGTMMTRLLKRAFLVSGLWWGGSSFAAYQQVSFNPPAQMPAQSIYIDLSQRALYLYLGDQQALRYPVAVGKAGRAWVGHAFIESKHIRPDWAPPEELRAAVPHLRNVSVIPGGHPSNPMGAAALMLNHGNYAIHGTNTRMRSSVGSAASFGCIRMYNEDVLDLYQRVEEGALVVVGN